MDEGEHLLSQPGNNAGYDTASVAYGTQKGTETRDSFFRELTILVFIRGRALRTDWSLGR